LSIEHLQKLFSPAKPAFSAERCWILMPKKSETKSKYFLIKKPASQPVFCE